MNMIRAAVILVVVFALILVVVFALMILIASATSCSSASSTTTVAVTDYGNGVYYFPYTKANFGRALSDFIASNPNLRLVTISTDDAYGYGITAGYFVVFEARPPKASE